jgi:hypothetical protein
MYCTRALTLNSKYVTQELEQSLVAKHFFRRLFAL